MNVLILWVTNMHLTLSDSSSSTRYFSHTLSHYPPFQYLVWYQNISSTWPLSHSILVSPLLHGISSYFTACPWLTIAPLLAWPTGLSRCSIRLPPPSAPLQPPQVWTPFVVFCQYVDYTVTIILDTRIFPCFLSPPVFTSTLRPFSRRFYSKRLTKHTFVRRKRNNNISLLVQ